MEMSELKELKILIVGGAGFIGSHLVDSCLAAGMRVGVLDNFSTGRKVNLLGKSAEVFEVDILNKEELAKVFKEFKPQIVSHQAAQVSVRRSLIEPAFDAQTNIIGTINLLEQVKANQVQQFLFASSGGAIYGENESRLPALENTLPKPLSPYAIAKLAAEFYIKYFSVNSGFKSTIFRYANVYGPRQDPLGEAGVISQFLGRFAAKEVTVINGNGEQVRDFVFVKDLAQAHLKAIQQSAVGTINIGSGEVKSVNQVHQQLRSIWQQATGQDVPETKFAPAILGEIFWSSVDTNLAQEQLDWRAQTSFEAGLEQTVDWFLDQNP